MYYEQGAIHEEAQFFNNLREGLGMSYHPNGRIEVRVDFKNGRMLSCEQFDENGASKKTFNAVKRSGSKAR